MGFLNKIKTILFEEEPNGDDVNLPPRYDEENSDNKVEEKEIPEVEEKKPIISNDDSRFKIKRDLDTSFDDDILEDVGNIPVIKEEVKEEIEIEETVDNDIFQAFDESEFEGAYSRLRKNEEAARENEEKEDRFKDFKDSFSDRRSNDAFSATNTSDSLRRQEEGTKKFKPSPVLSPVFGVLNVNYTKEDIVDRKGGMKREKVNPIKKKEEPKKEEVEDKKDKKDLPKIELPKEEKKDSHVEVDIDEVRKKAYGAIEDIEKEAIKEKGKDDDTYFTSVEITKEKKSEPVKVEKIKKEEPKIEEVSVEEEVDNNYVLDTEEEETSKPVVLDDLEKTSTLQILDDIEKELNSIKPITKENKVEEEVHDRVPSVENSDTLENDLFNLIDSMYETGEEEEND